MRLLMLKTCRGSEDGINSKEYFEGQTYEISDRLAKMFLEMGVAQKEDMIVIIPDDQNPENEKKDSELDNKQEPKPDNKAIETGEMSNKSKGRK